MLFEDFLTYFIDKVFTKRRKKIDVGISTRAMYVIIIANKKLYRRDQKITPIRIAVGYHEFNCDTIYNLFPYPIMPHAIAVSLCSSR